MPTAFSTVLHGRKKLIRSSASRLFRIRHQFRWDRNAVRSHIHHSRLADSRIGSEWPSAPRVPKLLSEIDFKICHGDGSHCKLGKYTRLIEVGVDSGCQTCISRAENCLHRCTDSPAFRGPETEHWLDQFHLHRFSRIP